MDDPHKIRRRGQISIPAPSEEKLSERVARLEGRVAAIERAGVLAKLVDFIQAAFDHHLPLSPTIEAHLEKVPAVDCNFRIR